MVQQLKSRQVKRRINEMIPVKEWLSLEEACSYMDMHKNNFMPMANEKHLTVSIPSGKKRFYRVSELKALFENNIIIKQ